MEVWGLKILPYKNPFLTTIELTFDEVPSEDTEITLAELKHGKDQGIAIVKDDAYEDDYTIMMPMIQGGVPDFFGNIYPGFRVDDGCGNLRPWPITIGLNANPVHNDEGGVPGSATWTQLQAEFDFGFYPANHGYHHGSVSRLYDILENRKSVYDRFGLPMGPIIIPSAEEGYVITGSRNFAPWITSQYGVLEVADGFEAEIQTFDRIVPANFNRERTLSSRAFTYDNSAPALADIFAGYEAAIGRSPKAIYHYFSHGQTAPGEDPMPYYNLLQAFADHEDFPNTGIYHLQEIWDYEMTKRSVHVNKKIVGKKMTINLSFRDVDKHIYYLDVSTFLSGTGSSITGANVKASPAGATIAFNPETGLVNVNAKNDKVISPYDDPLPPQLISAVMAVDRVTLTYDRPVDQTLFAAYQVIHPTGPTNNPVTAITGAGIEWELECENTISSGSKLYYRAQDGDAVDADDPAQYVPTYMGEPITE